MIQTAQKSKQRSKIARPIFVTALIILLTIIGSLSLFRVQQLEKAKTKLTYQAEAMYQRSFGELTDSVQTMHYLLAQLLITSEKEQLLYGLTSLWREVYAAINSLSALPVAMHELEKTDLLLHDIAEYSYYLMKQHVLTQHLLTAEDWEQIEQLYHRTAVVQTELKTLKETLLTESFYLTSIALDDENNPISSTFHSIENQITAFPALEFEEGIRQIAPELPPIAGTHISQNQALNVADHFLQKLLGPAAKTLPSGKLMFILNNTATPVYGVSYSGKHYVVISQIGGCVLQYYHTRELFAPAYTMKQAETQAQQLLQTLALSDMVCVERKLEETVASFIFVPIQDNVYLYPDMVKLQIALDDASLFHFDQSNYQLRHHDRILPQPVYTQTDILKNRNPNFQIESVHLALITNPYNKKEVLTYELRGRILNEQFAVFVDAQTGEELRIVHL